MKALVILSGGMDSTAVLSEVLKMYEAKDVATITFNYGSKHNKKENAAAKKVAEFYGVPNTLVELPFIDKLFKSDLLKSGGEIPEGHYADPSMQKTVVPFRNTIMMSIAAGYAESIGAKELWLGNHAGDHAVYPDCRKEYTDAMAEVLKLGGYQKIYLCTPFGGITKTMIAKIGVENKAPFDLTWSCYKGGKKHCGKCGTCVERLEAFKDSGNTDPVEYE